MKREDQFLIDKIAPWLQRVSADFSNKKFAITPDGDGQFAVSMHLGVDVAFGEVRQRLCTIKCTKAGYSVRSEASASATPAYDGPFSGLLSEIKEIMVYDNPYLEDWECEGVRDAAARADTLIDQGSGRRSYGTASPKELAAAFAPAASEADEEEEFSDEFLAQLAATAPPLPEPHPPG